MVWNIWVQILYFHFVILSILSKYSNCRFHYKLRLYLAMKKSNVTKKCKSQPVNLSPNISNMVLRGWGGNGRSKQLKNSFVLVEEGCLWSSDVVWNIQLRENNDITAPITLALSKNILTLLICCLASGCAIFATGCVEVFWRHVSGVAMLCYAMLCWPIVPLISASSTHRSISHTQQDLFWQNSIQRFWGRFCFYHSHLTDC